MTRRMISSRTSRSRPAARAQVFALLLIAGLGFAACSDDSPSANAAESSPSGFEERNLAFAKCMRENGVEDFPDPAEDGSMALLQEDSGIDPESPEYLKAAEACKDFAPPPPGEEEGEPADMAEAREWAQCVRDNGVPEFPDPELKGNALLVDTTELEKDGENPALDSALEECEKVRPSGNLSMVQNGPGE